MGNANVNAQPKVAVGKTRTSPFMREFKKNGPLFLMLLPGAALVTLFNYIPMPGIILAFMKIKPGKIFQSTWVGLDNFMYLFGSGDLWMIVRNTLSYNLIFISVGLISAVAFAIALTELRQKHASRVYQTIIMLPHFLSWVIVAYLVRAFLSPEKGVVNYSVLPMLGMAEGEIITSTGTKMVGTIDWYIQVDIWPYLLVFINLWKHVGYSSIVYCAAIAGIDQEIYEAALIDGASKWQQIRNITIPSITPLIIIMTILNVGKIFNADFGLFYQVPMQSGVLFPVTQVIDTYVYRMVMGVSEGGYEIGAATGFCQSICGFILVYTTNRIVRAIDEEKSLF